jgi:hypothetical protein
MSAHTVGMCLESFSATQPSRYAATPSVGCTQTMFLLLCCASAMS